MASDANIEAAINNYGSNACWTVPGYVEWSQNVAPAPSLSPAEAAALKEKLLGKAVSTMTAQAAPQGFEVTSVSPDQLHRIGGAAVQPNTQAIAAA